MTWLKAKLGGLAIGLGMAAAEPDWQLERRQALHQIPGISSLAWTPEGLYVLADNIPLLYRLDAEGEIKQRISLDPERPDPHVVHFFVAQPGQDADLGDLHERDGTNSGDRRSPLPPRRFRIGSLHAAH